MHSLDIEEINSQVSKICNFESFRKSERLSSFLRYVVDEVLQNGGKNVKAWSIAVEVFNRPNHFDAQTDSIVRVYGGKLRRALDNYYKLEGREDQIVISIPKGSYQPIFELNGSNTRNYPEDKTGSVQAPSLSKRESNPSIAVLMFEFLNKDVDYQFLATGLTEETIISLTRFPHYEVVGPLSREVIRKQMLDIRTIGDHYHVRFVLDGTVRILDDKFRLTVRLVDSITGKQLWGSTIDFALEIASSRELEDKVIGPITATIADSYGVIQRIMSKETFSQPIENSASYEAMLRFYHYLRVFSPDSFNDAVNGLNSAIETDPNNPFTLGMLGNMIAISYQFGYTDDITVLDEAEQLSRKAVALDPNCQPAAFTVALIHFLKMRGDEFLAAYERILRLNPNNAQWIASTYVHVAMLGEWDIGISQMNRAMRLNPHHPGWYYFASIMNFYRLEDYDQALHLANKFNSPNLLWDPLVQAAILGQLGRQQEAKKAIDDLLHLVPDFQQRARDLMRRLIYTDENIDMLLDGLRKGGMKVDG